MNERYSQIHEYGKVTFTLSEYVPNIQEVRMLMLKVIEQAIRDYCMLAHKHNFSIIEQELYDTAKQFLFDDSYKISWGDLKLSCSDIVDILDIDISWVRKQIEKRLETMENENGFIGDDREL